MSKTPLGNTQSLADMVSHLAKTIDARAGGDPKDSYTAKLLSKGPLHCGKKIAEEGAELALALAAQGKSESASEAADLLYHMMVGLRAKGVNLDSVADALRKRQGVSGLEEKAARKD
ncbi:MAG: phosphoribosyl-ATP diphosphatase [Pseudomonadota bacterium]